MLALTDTAFARLVIAANAIAQHERGRSLPKGQHLLLVGRAGLRLNETAGPVGQPLSIALRHVSHLRGDDLRHVSDPTFLHIERQDPNRSIVLPF
jgi:hypothetical protein